MPPALLRPLAHRQRGRHPQPVVPDRGQRRAAREHGHVYFPGGGEPRRDNSADGPGTNHTDTHSHVLLCCLRGDVPPAPPDHGRAPPLHRLPAGRTAPKPRRPRAVAGLGPCGCCRRQRRTRVATTIHPGYTRRRSRVGRGWGMRFGGPRHGGQRDLGNDLTMVAGSRKVHLAPRGRERRKAGPDPGSHQSKASTKLHVRVAPAPEKA